MKRTLSGIALVALAFAACTSNSASPSNNDGGTTGDGGNTCQAPGVSAACTSCLDTNCTAASAAAQSDCSAAIGCYCACNLGDSCCVEACGASVTSTCVNDAKSLATCATTSCASVCTVTVPGVCTSSDGGGATDASDAQVDSGPVCILHAPSGFSQVVADPTIDAVLTGAATGRAQSMVLDENDDPMFAYATYEGTADTYTIHFVRWDACAGQFTTPITVDGMHSGAQPDVSIAYDPTTKEIGIAYEKSATDNNWADSFGEIYLATMKAPATTFTTQELSYGTTDYWGAGGPSIAMGGGHIYVAYWQNPYTTVVDNNGYANLVWFLSSSSTPSVPPETPPGSAPDGSVGDASPEPFDASGEDAGPTPPHYFSYEAVPYVNGTSSAANGFVGPDDNSGTVSVAIDSNGVPAVATYQVSQNYEKEVVFWRANTASAVHVYSFTLDGSDDLSLVFEGTKPRIAGHMDTPVEADANTEAPDALKFFESPDGVTWSGGVNLPNNDGSQGTAFTSALAVDGLGNAAVVSDINGGLGNGMNCGTNPYVATSSDEDDGGAVWAACGVDSLTNGHAYSPDSVIASYGSSRLKGTLTLSFVTGAGDVPDASADQSGLIFWQHP